jgi:phosphoserine phosphatase RsbU/P
VAPDAALLHRVVEPVAAALGQLPQLSQEEQRQRAVDALGLGEDVREERFDRITRVARTLLGARMSTITVLDRDRACYPGAAGYDGASLPREQTFCHTATQQRSVLIVPDARHDPRFAHLDLVAAGEVSFYAGVPLSDPHGNVVGVLCVFDPEPGTLEGDRLQAFLDLSTWAEQELLNATEMSRAAQVQTSLLPERPLRLPGWSVAGRCLPALAVGGDFYDYGASHGALHLGLGDVMGKGTGAALVGAGVRAALRGTHGDVVGGADLGRTATAVARSLHHDLERSGAFAALIEAVVDLADGSVRFVDAGLGLMVVVRADGTVERHLGGDRPFGLFADDAWSERRSRLDPGDRLLVFTDGVLDLVDDPVHWWEPVGELVAAHDDPEELLAALAALTRERTPLDDVTALAVYRAPGQAA